MNGVAGNSDSDPERVPNTERAVPSPSGLSSTRWGPSLMAVPAGHGGCVGFGKGPGAGDLNAASQHRFTPVRLHCAVEQCAQGSARPSFSVCSCKPLASCYPLRGDPLYTSTNRERPWGAAADSEPITDRGHGPGRRTRTCRFPGFRQDSWFSLTSPRH